MPVIDTSTLDRCAIQLMAMAYDSGLVMALVGNQLEVSALDLLSRGALVHETTLFFDDTKKSGVSKYTLTDDGRELAARCEVLWSLMKLDYWEDGLNDD